MTEDERGILIVDAIFYVFLGLVLLSFIHWQTKADAMSAIELISYVNKGSFALKASGLFCFMACCVIFMLFCVIATFIIMGERSTWLGLVLSVGLAIIGIAWMLFSFDKLDYCANVGSTEKVATYIVPKSRVKQTNIEADHPYQLAVPKNKFIEKTTVKSASGYTQIDGHTFEVNGKRFTIKNKNNVIRHHAFGRERQSVTYTKYTWKKSVSASIKKSYDQNFGQLDRLDKVEIYE